MTRRLPATLKKRLQANLETLTPLEAGRLALVYYHESTGKKIGITDYPPAKELFAAFNARFDRAKGKPNERETVAAYNGFRFLVGLIETINTEAPGRLLESAFDAYQAQTVAGMILQQDAAGQVIAHLTRTLVTQPQPLQPELYDQVVAWLNGDRLVMLSEVAAGEVEGEEDDLNPWGDIPDDFKATHIENEDPADPDLVYLRAAEPIRKAWAEAQGDRLLDAFAGDRSRLDAWIETGELYADEDAVNARKDQIVADLVVKLRAGELVGGQAVAHHPSLYTPVLIDAGRFPTWAALRILWRPFAESRDFRFDEDATVSTRFPGRADVIRDLKGRRLSPEELSELVAAFWKACRGRSWGKKLPATTDADALADFLTWSPSFLLHLLAPDLGTVVFATWEQADGHALLEGYDKPWVKGPAATAASLHAVIGGHDWGENEIAGDRFFRNTTGNFFQHNESLAYWLSLADRLMPRRQYFTYLRKEDEEDGLLPMSAILGIELLTLLESTIAKYRQAADELANIKAALTVVSERYFGGMPVLTKYSSPELERAEKHLANTEKWLKGWIADLNEDWNIDTTNLELGEPEVDKERVEFIVEKDWLRHARQKMNIKDETGLLW